ncbi:hypothetical protein ACJMK2_000633 [Sinanodonta woodiana]|uniref:Uncharacterized protein n=1 Tax=Sinanodonta woodiana TaxID=1069815 RepID=A0ABD3XT59_SINWO
MSFLFNSNIAVNVIHFLVDVCGVLLLNCNSESGGLLWMCSFQTLPFDQVRKMNSNQHPVDPKIVLVPCELLLNMRVTWGNGFTLQRRYYIVNQTLES